MNFVRMQTRSLLQESFRNPTVYQFKNRRASQCNKQNATSLATGGLETKASVKPFNSIPGPKALPLIGNLWRYVTGEYSFDRLHATGLKKYKQFGPIVREEIVPGVNLLLLFQPEDIERMYQLEGRYPSRRSHTALEFYRLQKPDIYGSGGLLPTNGPEWHRLRQSLQRPINIQENIRQYISDIDDISYGFVEKIVCGQSTYSSNDNTKQPTDFLDDLSRVFLEFLGLVAFDTRLGSLDKNLTPESRPLKLIKAAQDTNSEILRTDNGLQLWRRWKTPAYKKVQRSQEYIESVALEFVNAKKNDGSLKQKIEKGDTNKTLLEVYLTSPDLNFKDVVTMISDMLLAGIDTSSYTTSFILYHLAKNPFKQEKLFKEVNELLPTFEHKITQNVLSEMKYLKAVVKESFRLNPISIGVGRILPEDSTFSGYLCPKNTILVSQNQVSCKLEKFFNNPLEFIPERWIKGNPAYEKTHPYLVLPFGHGPRACIARRLAEQNLYILIARLIQRFHIEWNGMHELDSKSQLINRPDGPLSFNFVDRKTR